MTISPTYRTSKGFNPFYVLNKKFIELAKIKGIKKPRFKCIDNNLLKQGKYDIIYKSKGSAVFQIYDDQNETNMVIICTKSKADVLKHEGSNRKNSTASSNINEIFSLFYLIPAHKKLKKYDDLLKYLSDNLSATSGILTGEGKAVTYDRLYKMLDEDDTAEDDAKIGYNNATAIEKDLGQRISDISILYWTYREKPKGVNPKNPSDIVIEFSDKSMIGYSNKAIHGSGADLTPKINTNLTAFFRLGKNTENEVQDIIDNAWNLAKKDIQKLHNYNINKVLDFDIKQKKYSETTSKDLFSSIGKVFEQEGLNFFKDDFYYKFRNNIIKQLIQKIQGKNTYYSKYILEEMGRRTFGNRNEDIPYKLLIGSTKGSKIKDVSNNDKYLSAFMNLDNANIIASVKYNESQSFVINYTIQKTFNILKFSLPITIRTRASGGWSGKNLFISSSGPVFV